MKRRETSSSKPSATATELKSLSETEIAANYSHACTIRISRLEPIHHHGTTSSIVQMPSTSIAPIPFHSSFKISNKCASTTPSPAPSPTSRHPNNNSNTTAVVTRENKYSNRPSGDGIAQHRGRMGPRALHNDSTIAVMAAGATLSTHRSAVTSTT